MLAEPLHNLLRREKSFHCNSSFQKAFNDLKQRLVRPPVLTFPDFSQQFKIYVDTSDVAISGILGHSWDCQEWVIYYWSRQLQKAKHKYSTIEREALAAVSAVKEFYAYLCGFPFKLITDHNPLVSLKGLNHVHVG